MGTNYLYQSGQHPHQIANDFAAFVANPDAFFADALDKFFDAKLANWQPSAPTAPAVDPDELHDVPASAKFLGVVPQTIHTYAKEGILNPLRLRPGGKLYFKKSDLLAALTRSGAGQRSDGRRKAGRAANKKA